MTSYNLTESDAKTLNAMSMPSDEAVEKVEDSFRHIFDDLICEEYNEGDEIDFDMLEIYEADLRRVEEIYNKARAALNYMKAQFVEE